MARACHLVRLLYPQVCGLHRLCLRRFSSPAFNVARRRHTLQLPSNGLAALHLSPLSAHAQTEQGLSSEQQRSSPAHEAPAEPPRVDLRQERATAAPDAVGVVLQQWRVIEEHPALLPASLSQLRRAAARGGVSPDRLTQCGEFSRLSRLMVDLLPRLPPAAALECFLLLHRCGLDPHSPLLRAFSDAALRALADQSLEEVSTLLGRGARATPTNETSCDVFAAIADKFVVRLKVREAIAPVSLCRTACFLSDMGVWPDDLCTLLVAHLQEFISTWQDHRFTSIILRLLIKHGVDLKPTGLLDRGGVAVARVIGRDRASNLVGMSWVFGSAPHYQREYFDALSLRLLEMRDADDPRVTPRLLATVAWACARVRYYSPPLMEHLSQLALARLGAFNSHDLANLGYAAGFLNHPSEELLWAIVRRLEASEDFMSNVQACINIVWACLVHDLYPPSLLRHLFSAKHMQGT